MNRAVPRRIGINAIAMAMACQFVLVFGCSTSIEKSWEFPTSSPLYSTPLILNELIVFGSESGTLYAVNQKGQTRWQYSVPSAEIYSRPVSDGKLVYFGATSQNVYAVDLRGQVRWQFAARERIKSDVAIKDGVVYATSYDGHIYALKPDNGDLIWQFPADEEPKEADPEDAEPSPQERIEPKAFSYAAPTIVDSVLYVGNLDGYMYAVNTKDGSLKWRFKTGSGVTSSALVHAGTLYFGSKDDHLYAIDTATGTQVKWKFKAGGDVLSSPKISEGVIFIGANDKNFYAIDAKTGKEKCHFTASGEVISYGAFYKNLVFFGGGQNDGHIYALNKADCSLFFKYKTGYKIESDPIILDNNLYITSGDRKLYAFKINKTTQD